MTSKPIKMKIVDRRLVILVSAVVIQLALGIIYAWPVFTPLLKEAGWTRLDTQIAFSVSLAARTVAVVWAGSRMACWEPRWLVVGSGLLLGGGYILAGLLGATSFSVIVLCIGLIGGTGIGLGYVVPIAVGMRWFPHHRGLVAGITVTGYGLGATIWIKVAGDWGLLIAHYGLDLTFILYGVILSILVLIGSTWMILPPRSWHPVGWSPSSAAASVAPGQEYTGREMLKTLQFTLLFLTFAASSGAGLMSIGLMQLYPMEALQASGLSQSEASAIASTAMAAFFSIANGIGRIVWGMVGDHIGPRRALLLLTLNQGIALPLFTFMAGQELFLYLGATLIGFNFGGNFALFPSITASAFGLTSVGQNYPLLSLASGAGGIVFPILGGLLGDLGYFPLAFTLCGGACLIGTVLIYLVRPLPGQETIQ